MTIESPTLLPATLNGTPAPESSQLAQRQPERLAVMDEGAFANLLDTAKFDHLWRVARLFAASTMVPVHFQRKPEDCFVACQMAIRLGVDPFMFMQNTYVTQGKPGMEGKLAIALVNTSGLFTGPIRFVYSGQAGTDGYGCHARAVLKATGEEVVGPRVTIAIAKSEGWHSRNPKWKSVPDLMLMYRAGSWFGRSVCPERLMGMQTVDELRDIGADGTVTNSVGAQTKTQRLNARLANPSRPITSRPVDDGHTFEPVDDAEARIAAQDEHVAEFADDPAQHGGDDPDVSGADTGEPPEDADPATSWAGTMAEAAQITAAKGWGDDGLQKRVDGFLLKKRCKGSPEKLTQAQRAELLAALDAEPALPGE